MEDQFPKLDGVLLAERYLLTEEVGRGGFGVVYRGTQLNINRDIAVKILPPQFMAIPDVVERFKREAQLASLLCHPNTITIHDYGSQDNMLYIVMELLRGEDLADILKRERRFDKDRIVHIAKQVLKSLAEAHQQGIVHRDLKPENIFLHQVTHEPDFVKVLDFGIAKLAQPGGQASQGRQLTVTGSTVGTPVYMSPEQAAGEEVDAQTDLYALGIIMYEMLTGRPPFQDDNPVKIMRAHLFTPVPPLPQELRGSLIEHVILRALEKEKDARYRSANEFLKDLEKSPSKIIPLPSHIRQALTSAPPELEEDSEPSTLELKTEDDRDEDIPLSLDHPRTDPQWTNPPPDRFGAASLQRLQPPPRLNAPDQIPFEQLGSRERQPIIEGASASGLTSRSGLLPSPHPHYTTTSAMLSERSSAGLNTVSSILTIVEPPPEEEVILLTRPKHTPHQGVPSLSPQTNPSWEVDPSLRQSQELDAMPPRYTYETGSSSDMIRPSSPYSTDEKLIPEQLRQPPAPAPQPQVMDTPAEDEALEPGQPPNWSWGNVDASVELTRDVESGAYPQLKQKQQLARAQRRKWLIGVLVALLIVMVLALIALMATQSI